MALDLRGMERREWTQILRRETVVSAVDSPEFCGYAGLMHILEVSEPFVRKVVLADRNYMWLQIAPAEANWWLTVMYAPDGELIQYYFDITARNFVSASSEPMFEDLYLDIVMQPDGEIILLDRDELDAALEAGKVTSAQHRLAVRTAEILAEKLIGHEPEWRAMCAREKERLQQMLRQKQRMIKTDAATKNSDSI